MKSFRNVGSGVVERKVNDMKDEFGCETCRHMWSVKVLGGMYGCQRDGCEGKGWRARSQEDGRCPSPSPWCHSDSVGVNSDSGEIGGGIFQCSDDSCVYSSFKWKVVEDSEVGACPWCGEEWWRVGEEEKHKCPECGGTGVKGCMCDKCMKSGDRKYPWWKMGIVTARHVIYDVSELKSCEVVFFDNGRDQPLKLNVGESGEVLEADTEGDKMKFSVCTHDSTLVEELRKLMDDHKEVSDRIDKKTREFDVGRLGEVSRDKDVFHPGFLIGYPHGRHCHVTLGQMLDDSFPIKYVIDSCVGNSGCLVSSRERGFGDVFSSHSGQDKESKDKQVGTSCSSYSVLARLIRFHHTE